MIDIATTTFPATDATTTIPAADDAAPTPLKERAWALYCQGHRSPAIGEHLGVSERTVRHWISRITADLNAHHADQREHHLLLAIERKRQIATVTWDGYERAIALAETERAHAAQANDEVISTSCVRASRHALTTAVRYLNLIAANDRDLTTLTSLHDQQTHEREHQAAEQERQAREEEREQQREQARQDWERERLRREQDRLDRQRERESEPQPPSWLSPASLELEESLDPSERLPEVNAYFAARDAYHAARQTAANYARACEAAAIREETAANREAERAFVLSALSQERVADLLARLDAEEAADREAASAVAMQQSGSEQREPSSLPPAGGRAGEGATIEPTAKTAKPPDTNAYDLPATQPANWTIPASFRAPDDVDDEPEDGIEDGIENAAITANLPYAHPPSS